MICTVDEHGFAGGGPSACGWSKMGGLLACPAKWGFKHLVTNDGRVPTADPLIKGTLVHTGMANSIAQRYGVDCLDARDAIALQAKQFDAALGLQSGPWAEWVQLATRALSLWESADRLSFLQVMALEYEAIQWVAGEEFNETFVGPPEDAEQRIAWAREWSRESIRALVAAGPPYITTFRADCLGYNKQTGRVVNIDWKTGYRFDKRKTNGFQLSGQMAQFAQWGLATYPNQWGGVYVGEVNFSYVDSGKRDPFTFTLVDVTEATIKTFPRTVAYQWRLLKELLVVRDLPVHRWPRTLTEQGPCQDRYGACEHRDLCRKLAV